MPRLHAGFSLGMVIGAGLGLARRGAVSIAGHLGVVAGLVVGAVLLLVRYFLPPPPDDAGSADRGRARLRDAWRELRTMLIGVLVLTFALAEGVANEWLAVALVDGFGASPALGAVGFAIFVAAMTTSRMFGGVLIDRWGRVAVLRAGAVGAVAGVLVVVFGYAAGRAPGSWQGAGWRSGSVGMTGPDDPSGQPSGQRGLSIGTPPSGRPAAWAGWVTGSACTAPYSWRW